MQSPADPEVGGSSEKEAEVDGSRVWVKSLTTDSQVQPHLMHRFVELWLIMLLLLLPLLLFMWLWLGIILFVIALKCFLSSGGFTLFANTIFSIGCLGWDDDEGCSKV